MENQNRDIKVRFLSIKNSVDYSLRNLFRYSKPVKEDAPIPGIDHKVQKEFSEFLDLFNWEEISDYLQKDNCLEIADVGARNFCFAPVIDEVFKKQHRDINLYGIELDAYRRLSNLHTRYDYGIFYSKLCRSAEFHPLDFLKWNKPLDLAFLLNPFVTEEPTVYWGLPLSALRPVDFFNHAFHLLAPRKGIAIVSSPSIQEFELALGFALKAGFKLGPPDEEVAWRPGPNSQQKKPRYGIVLHSKIN